MNSAEDGNTWHQGKLKTSEGRVFQYLITSSQEVQSGQGSQITSIRFLLRLPGRRPRTTSVWAVSHRTVCLSKHMFWQAGGDKDSGKQSASHAAENRPRIQVVVLE